jgi:hypothetical protein
VCRRLSTPCEPAIAGSDLLRTPIGPASPTTSRHTPFGRAVLPRSSGSPVARNGRAGGGAAAPYYGSRARRGPPRPPMGPFAGRLCVGYRRATVFLLQLRACTGPQ